MRWGLINVSPQCYNTTLQRKEAINDNTRPIVSGWRFIHHPKVKKDRCYQRDTPTSIWLGACATRNAKQGNSLDISISKHFGR